ncbi:MAG: 23S rRNA (uracil(1939)-C(5))-methyltransferase RlmD, partial [Clostridia bacterium]|nr:23S rRNA (uracil(1939)-C(5))-methyltransferase RlmD [Clostridia bacterium]
YSGVGLLTAQLAMRMQNANIISVEIEPSASSDAEKLMQSLGLSDRVQCICDDAKHYLDKNDKKSARNSNGNSNEKRRALILDPPRRGCDREVLERATGFDKIVYISCNPQTLARDIKILSEEYDIEFVKPFDMFPQTANVECVALLVKK